MLKPTQLLKVANATPTITALRCDERGPLCYLMDSLVPCSSRRVLLLHNSPLPVRTQHGFAQLLLGFVRRHNHALVRLDVESRGSSHHQRQHLFTGPRIGLDAKRMKRILNMYCAKSSSSYNLTDPMHLIAGLKGQLVGEPDSKTIQMEMVYGGQKI